MDFGWALTHLKGGSKVTRKGWNGKGMYLELFRPYSDLSLPFIYMTTVDGTLVPWTASQTDILAEDWEGS